jgi:hypothetical protein
MLPNLNHIYRTWLEVDPIGDLQGLAVPVYAKPSKTKLAGHVLTVELNPCPERDALLKGRRWEVSGMPFVGMFAIGHGLYPRSGRPDQRNDCGLLPA